MTSATQRTRRARTRPARRTLWSDPRAILALATILIAAALIGMYLMRDTSAPSTGHSALETAYDFRLPGLGGEVALADFRGRYVLVNFWATWCPPCRDEMPDLQAYYDTYKDFGFTLLAVNEQEDAATVRQFVESFGFTFPVALDLTGAVMKQYGTQSLPTSYLIGPDGRLIKSWVPGRLSRATLERDVTPLLKSS